MSPEDLLRETLRGKAGEALTDLSFVDIRHAAALRRRTARRAVILAAAVVVLMVGAPTAILLRSNDDLPNQAPSANGSVTPSVTPTVGAVAPLPCDPGGGSPRMRVGCPDSQPVTGWLTKRANGQLWVKPFRVYTDNAAGKAYARRHGIHYPFFQGFYEAPDGPSFRIDLNSVICSGIANVGGTRGGQADHLVACSDMSEVAARMQLTVAIWRKDTRIFQVSELYRP